MPNSVKFLLNPGVHSLVQIVSNDPEFVNPGVYEVVFLDGVEGHIATTETLKSIVAFCPLIS